MAGTIKKWYICLFLSALFIIIWIYFLPIQFETDDDSTYMMYMAGYWTGTPTAYALYPSIILGFFISRLYMMIPILPWYTIAHFFVLWVSAATVCFCIFDSAINKKYSYLVSSVAVTCFLAVFFSYSLMMLQFTTTPAVAVGAAIVLLLHYENRDKRFFIFTTAMATLLMSMAYSFRPEIAYIGFCIYTCIAAVRFFQYEEERKYIVIITLFPILAFIILYGINYSAYNIREFEPFERYQKEIISFYNYDNPPYKQAPEAYENAGIDEIEAELIRNWYLYIDIANDETFKALNEGIREYYLLNPRYQNNSIRENLDIYTGKIDAVDYNRYCFFVLIYLFGIILFSSSPIPVSRKSDNIRECLRLFVYRHGNKIIAFGILVFFLSSNIYFINQGRFVYRAYRALVYISAPALIYLAANMFHNKASTNINKPEALRKIQRILIAGLSLCLTINCVQAVSGLNKNDLQRRKDGISLPPYYMYDYAINHPDNVYFSDISGVSDPLIVYPKDKPTNYINIIGGFIHTPMYYKQLAINGFSEISKELLVDNRAYLLTFKLNENLEMYYKMHYPEHEFVLVDEIPAGVKVYKLLQYS